MKRNLLGFVVGSLLAALTVSFMYWVNNIATAAQLASLAPYMNAILYVIVALAAVVFGMQVVNAWRGDIKERNHYD